MLNSAITTKAIPKKNKNNFNKLYLKLSFEDIKRQPAIRDVINI